MTFAPTRWIAVVVCPRGHAYSRGKYPVAEPTTRIVIMVLPPLDEGQEQKQGRM